MSPRFLLVLTAALAVLVAGCSGGDSAPSKRTEAEAIRPVKVRIPADKPFYGKRQEGDPWRTSGHVPKPAHPLPFTKGILSEGQLKQDVDENGVRDYVNHGTHYAHPVAIAQYGLAKLDQANRTDSAEALRVAKANAAKLIEVADHHEGGLYFAYPFDFSLGGHERHTIHAPWWSAMAQGEALSLFVRLYNATGEERWREAADKTFATLDDRGPTKGPWTVYVDKRHYLWLEEYAGDTKPLIVLNGHMFALFGIWDYARLTHSPKARNLFDAGVTTLREYLPQYRVDGEASYYCLRRPFCHRDSWQNQKYHGIVYRQIRFIADMTDDPWFAREAKRFNQDFDGWPIPKSYFTS